MFYAQPENCAPGLAGLMTPVSGVDAMQDLDGDGLKTWKEYANHPRTNPCHPDTDDDGLSDGLEATGLLAKVKR